MPTIEWVRLEPVHIGDPVSTSTLLVAFFIECLFHLSLVMTSQEHSDGAKPRVLLLGRNHADQSVMDELERVADVYILPPVEQPAVSAAIGKMVAQHGPFLAVVVGTLHVPSHSLALMADPLRADLLPLGVLRGANGRAGPGDQTLRPPCGGVRRRRRRVDMEHASGPFT